MVNKNTTEIYSRYSKKLPFWVINPENKPTLDAYQTYITDQSIFTNNNNDLFRYDERTLDTLTIISKDPDIKYLILDITSSTPIIAKPTLYTDFLYHVERVSFYAMGVWKLEFKRDYITLWVQFLQNIRFNSSLGNIRTLTTRTNLIDDNHQFEDEKLKSLPLKISGWKVEELIPANDILSYQNEGDRDIRYIVQYSKMSKIWGDLPAGSYKSIDITFMLRGEVLTRNKRSFQEYYVFNTEEKGMLFIPVFRTRLSVGGYGFTLVNDFRTGSEYGRIYDDFIIEKHLVNNKWASQFLGVFLLPNWLTTSIPFRTLNTFSASTNGETYEFINMIYVDFGIDTLHIKSINYQIPEFFKKNIERKLGIKNKYISQSILQSIPTYLNVPNVQINLQKYPNFFDYENNIMRFEYDFIFNGQGIATYHSRYEQMENWIKNLPQQLPSSSSKFAQYIQANQNTFQTGIWVKQEEAKINQASGIANALVGAVGAGLGVYGVGQIGQLASMIGDPLTGVFGNINGGLGAIHGANQAIQGITNAIRAENEVKFEKARVKAKYADTFNSSTRQINYSQAIDALAKELTETRNCDTIIYPIIDNLDVYNDTIVRYGNKTYEFFKLNDLITVGEGKKFNYIEVNTENFLKETNNFPIIWEHFTYEDISQLLSWLESGIRIWNTKEVEYDYQE